MKRLLNKWMIMEGKYGTSESMDKVKGYNDNFVNSIHRQNFWILNNEFC